MMNKYKSSLCESYRDFAFIFDKDLGAYVVSLEPVDVNAVDTVFIDVTDKNQKDSIDAVINYVDEYYNKTDEDLEEFTEDVEPESEHIDTLKTLYGDLFVVELIRADNGEKELIEFTDIIGAQNYIDKIKIDNDEFFSKATLLDENDEILDSWEYVNIEKDESKDKEESNEEIIEEDVIDTTVEEPKSDIPIVVEVPIESNEEVLEIVPEIDTIVSNDSWAKYIIDAYSNSIVFANNMKMLHWFAKGTTFDILHSITEEYTNKAYDNVDFLAELLIEMGVTVNNPHSTVSTTVTLLEQSDIEKNYMSCLKNNIDEFCCALFDARVTDNLASDIVSEFDTIIRYWTKENSYKNVRRMSN